MEDSSLGLRNEEIQSHISFMAKVFQKCSMPQTDVSQKGELTVFSTQAKSEQTSKGRNGSSMKHQEELTSDKVPALVP